MENKDTIVMVRGSSTLENWMKWFRNSVLRVLNKQWTVELPPNCGVATFKDSQDKVVLDLTKAIMGGAGSVVVEGVAPIVVTPAMGGVTTFTVSYSGGAMPALPESDGNYALKIVGGVASWALITITPVTLETCGGDTVVSEVAIA